MNSTLLNLIKEFKKTNFTLLFGVYKLNLSNILHYDPVFGYDGEAHHEYVQNFLNFNQKMIC